MTIVATVVLLGVLIFVHELGHFLAAKAVGIEVQRFSIGLGSKLWGFQVGETEYVLSIIPLGGYVKMGGMADEVMDRVEGGPVGDERVPGPRDFDGKPIWARTLVISAGVIMNLLFAFAAYTGVLAVWGLPEVATTQIGDVQVEALPAGTEPLAEMPPGAYVVAVGDREIEHWGQLRDALMEGPEGPTEMILTEPNRRIGFRLPSSEEERARTYLALRYWIDPDVGEVLPGSPAEEAGVEVDDRVLMVEGQPVSTWWDFKGFIEARPGERTELLLARGSEEIVRVVTPEATEEVDPVTGDVITVGRAGIRPPLDSLVHEDVSIDQAAVYGYRQTVAVTGLILGFLRDLVTGRVPPSSVGSIVMIGQASGQYAAMGLEYFLGFMALFSVNLAVLNMLPIPILDGGHLLFLGIEAVRGKALSVEQRLKWSNVGFLIVMGIMIWALGNDFLRLLGF